MSDVHDVSSDIVILQCLYEYVFHFLFLVFIVGSNSSNSWNILNSFMHRTIFYVIIIYNVNYVLYYRRLECKTTTRRTVIF